MQMFNPPQKKRKKEKQQQQQQTWHVKNVDEEK